MMETIITKKWTIPAGEQCQGYIWKSDKALVDQDCVIDGRFDGMELDANAAPFVIEANLMIDNCSYSIKCIDGQFHICRFENGDTGDAYDVLSLAAHGMPGISALKFKRVWREVEDMDCCLGFPVLQPAELIFGGFEK